MRRQALAFDPTSELLFDNVLQNFSIQRQINDNPFQPIVLIFQISQSTHLERHQPFVLFLPVKIRRQTYSRLKANRHNRRALIALLNNKHLLSVREFGCFHRIHFLF